MRPWRLDELNYADVKETRFEVAVLPCGATEPHNLHLPYGTDTFEADVVGDAMCGWAHSRGAKVLLLPTMPYGTETNQRECGLSMNVYPSTLGLVIRDLIESLVQSGIKKIVLLNSHGGNDFKPLLRELYGRTEAKLFLCNWYTVAQDKWSEIFERAEDHGGEMETSMGLAYFPDLVMHEPDGRLRADDGAVRTTRFEAVNAGWVSITRPWHLLTTNTGSGNPHAATADKARRMMDLVAERLGGFLVELSEAELDGEFPF